MIVTNLSLPVLFTVTPDKITIDNSIFVPSKVYSPGKHQITIVKDGYRSFSKEIDIPDDSSTFTVKCLLETIPRKVKFIATGNFSKKILKLYDIKLNGKSISDKTSFTPGNYFLEMLKGSYQNLTKKIAIPPSTRPLTIEEKLLEEPSIIRQSLSMEYLPPHVPVQENQLNLYVDYKDIKQQKFVAAYLINKTDQDISLPHQDGDIYVKLEAFTQKWERAQRHWYSGCGVSYMNEPVLKRNHFYYLLLKYPSQGTKRRIRYHVYSKLNLNSNEGIGYVNDDKVYEACLDDMAVYAHYYKIEEFDDCLEKLEHFLKTEKNDQARLAAIYSISDHAYSDKKRVLSVLQNVAQSDSYWAVCYIAVQSWAERAEKKPVYLLNQILVADLEGKVARGIVRAFSDLKYEEVISYLFDSLIYHPSAKVREEIVVALYFHYENNPKTIKELLQSATMDEDKRVRKKAMECLEDIESEYENSTDK